MEQPEVAVRLLPGALPRQGVVVQRGKTAAAMVLVRWSDGEQEKVKPKDPNIRFAPDNTKRLDWLLEPGSAVEEFELNPLAVFEQLIREAGKITTKILTRQLVELGLDEAEVTKTHSDLKDELKKHPHITVASTAHSWSDAPKPPPVGPFDHHLNLEPLDALELLATGKGLKAAEKLVLAEVIRQALPAK